MRRISFIVTSTNGVSQFKNYDDPFESIGIWIQWENELKSMPHQFTSRNANSQQHQTSNIEIIVINNNKTKEKEKFKEFNAELGPIKS